jgi:predicted double-glycine peptidase
MGWICLSLAFFLLSPAQAGAASDAEKTLALRLAEVEERYARLGMADRERRSITWRTELLEGKDKETYTSTGIREFWEELKEVYSLPDVLRGLYFMREAIDPSTGRPFDMDVPALNPREILYGSEEGMTARDETLLTWFQFTHQVDEGGVVGPKTWRKLREIQKEKAVRVLADRFREELETETRLAEKTRAEEERKASLLPPPITPKTIPEKIETPPIATPQGPKVSISKNSDSPSSLSSDTTSRVASARAPKDSMSRYSTDFPSPLPFGSAPLSRERRGNIEIPLIGGPIVDKKIVSLKEARFTNMVSQKSDFSCGAAALATILHYHFGMEMTERDVIDGMIKLGDIEMIRKRGFSLLEMQKFANHLGYKAQGFQINLDQLKKVNIPVIALITSKTGYKHFVVLKGVDGDQIFISDPSIGNLSTSLEDFAPQWNGIVFALQGPKYGDPAGLRLASLRPSAPKGEVSGIRERGRWEIAMDPSRAIYYHSEAPSPDSIFQGFSQTSPKGVP